LELSLNLELGTAVVGGLHDSGEPTDGKPRATSHGTGTTMNLEPGTLNFELGTLNLELGTLNLELGTWNFEL
jgi:hypothetical protein